MSIDSRLEPWVPRALAALRIVAGYLFLQHGSAKLFGFPHVAMFDHLSIWSLLGVAGVIAIVSAAAEPGVQHDAILHAIFLGFVVAMIFGHAPIIFPAILGRPMRYQPRFYLQLIVLHASVALRLLGDLVEGLGRWRAWGGLLNMCALLLFLLNTISSVIGSRLGTSARLPYAL